MSLFTTDDIDSLNESQLTPAGSENILCWINDNEARVPLDPAGSDFLPRNTKFTGVLGLRKMLA